MSKPVRFLPALFCAALMTIHATAKAQANFGSVAVGSSTSATVTVTVPTASSFTAVNVVTWGAAGLDFTALSGGTCATGVSYGAGQTCTVNVSFAPKYPGVRMGAVTLANPASNTYATTFLKGTATAPQVGFLPGTVTAIYPTLDGYPLPPASAQYGRSMGLAVDGTGTLSIATPVLNSGGTNIAQGGFLQIPAGSSVATLVPANGDQGDTITPVAVRVDGAGDRILNDSDYTLSLPPAATVATENAIGGLSSPAVDGAGNIYLYSGQNGNSTLLEYSPTMFDGNTISPIAGGQVATNGYPVVSPIAQAVNPRLGNVFIAGHFNVQDSSGQPAQVPLVEVEASQLADPHTCCTSADSVSVTANGVATTYASDAAFDLSTALLLADATNNRIVGLPSQGAISPVVDGKGLNNPQGLALDPAGNIFILDAGNSRVVKIDRSQQSLSFAPTRVGTASSDSPKTVVVQNYGFGTLGFSSIVAPPDFQVQTGNLSTDCDTSMPVAAGANCSLIITFKPQTPGTHTESIVLTDNSLNHQGATQTITVTGTATEDSLEFSATSLSFGNEPVGYSTASQNVTVTNPGPPVTISSIRLTGANAASFVTSNTCGSTLAQGSSCRIGVRFVPTTTGPATASVTLTDTASGSPQSITLSGTGVSASGASLSLSASSLAFGNEPVGQSTASKNVTVTNTSSAILYFRSIALTGTNAASFVTSNTCGTSLAAGANCRIGVRFVPAATGAASAAITLTDNASDSPQSITLTGTGQ